MTERPAIAIFGTGALAMLFGARLARAGARVRLIGSWREGLAAIGRRGIEVEEAGRSWRQPVATAEPGDAGASRADLALVLVKSHQTAAVAGAAAAAGDTVLTLQNGLGNRELLARAAGAERVALGLSSQGATVLAPGRVRDGGGGPIVLGRERRALAAPFTAAGFAVRLTGELERAVWQKLAINCAINPVTALVLEVARRTAGNRSSMLQDLDRGAVTEIEAICGAVVREGRRLHVATPVNTELLDRVRRRQGPVGDRRRLPAEVSA